MVEDVKLPLTEENPFTLQEEWADDSNSKRYYDKSYGNKGKTQIKLCKLFMRERAEMAIIFKAPDALCDVPMHYCPGCTHGIAHRLVAEAIDELEIEGKTIGISPVGCAYNNYLYFNCDMIQAAHGRAPAVATGVKRSLPESIVFTYQGDGDLAAIGTAEIVHAAARSENITVIFINNTIYGMTSGQMAPTTLLGQVTTTTPYGRDASYSGFPMRVKCWLH